MGCVECKFYRQEDENSQFEYPPKDFKKNETSAFNTEINSIQNIIETNSNKIPNKNFCDELESKVNSIGKFITEEEFQMAISHITNIYMQTGPFPFQRKNLCSYKMRPVEFSQGNMYHGEWNESLEMEGYGKYFLKEENVLCEGIWEKGELKNARIYYPNGEFYEGEMNNSLYNGKGKLVNENKDTYEGGFLDGQKDGEGKIIFYDGTEYSGNFYENNFNGYGKMIWKNGIKYKGYFSDNYLEGNGIMEGENEKYEGNFKNNLFNGKGKYRYENGDEYDGDFENGIRKGKGIYKQKNGFIFEGMWDNDVPNGFGKINLNEKIIKCNFHNGKLIEKPVDEDGLGYFNIDYNFYNQCMKLSGQRLLHLENPDVVSSIFKADSILSFLEE